MTKDITVLDEDQTYWNSFISTASDETIDAVSQLFSRLAVTVSNLNRTVAHKDKGIDALRVESRSLNKIYVDFINWKPKCISCNAEKCRPDCPRIAIAQVKANFGLLFDIKGQD